MPVRRVPWLPWTLVVLAVVVTATDVVIGFQNDQATGHERRVMEWLATVEMVLIPLTFTAVGAFVVFRRPGNRIGWLMTVIGLSFTSGSFFSDYAGVGYPARPLRSVVAWLDTWNWTVYVAGLMLLVFLFPTGQPAGRRWKPVLWTGLAAWCVVGVLAAVAREPASATTSGNPYGFLPIPVAAIVLPAAIGLGAVGASLVSLVLRFRTVRGVERQQLKWFAYGASLAVIFLVGTFATSWSVGLLVLLALASLAALPLFLGIAILRYRLYEIDVLINRTLVYGCLTVSLAGLYGGSILLLQALSRATVGQDSQPAVALATLIAVAVFTPWRRRVQVFIDRRFYRRRYDAARVLAGLQSSLRDEVELDQLTRELVSVVQETLQVRHVSLWLP